MRDSKTWGAATAPLTLDSFFEKNEGSDLFRFTEPSRTSDEPLVDRPRRKFSFSAVFAGKEGLDELELHGSFHSYTRELVVSLHRE